MRSFTRRAVAQATALYHRRVREAYEAKMNGLEADGVVQFVLAGYEVKRVSIMQSLGYKAPRSA